MIVACHCEGRGWKFWADSNLKGKFWGRSIQLDPVGVLTLQFEDGETFQWSKVTTSIYNIILGIVYTDINLKMMGKNHLQRNFYTRITRDIENLTVQYTLSSEPMSFCTNPFGEQHGSSKTAHLRTVISLFTNLDSILT
ncbi:hypothetical protein LguiA_008652 [Lonicera macranthoides]